MFTVEQIEEAHSNVKSGADFPSYIKEIKSLGVTHYETYVTDGHIDYHGENDYTATVPPKYEPLDAANTPETERFKAKLLAHQQGKTDYLTFIKMCADCGIENYDKAGNVLLVEEIPH